MTTPYERYRALKWSLELMQELQSNETAVPGEYRQQIEAIMQHLPTLEELDAITDAEEMGVALTGGIFPQALLSKDSAL